MTADYRSVTLERRNMSISIGSNSIYPAMSGIMSNNTKAKDLENTLNNSTEATDDELMEACKSFEAYMLEQVFKGMQKTVIKDEEEENDYLTQFGDMLYQEYAKDATKGQGIGLAQMLYEAMKRNGQGINNNL